MNPETSVRTLAVLALLALPSGLARAADDPVRPVPERCTYSSYSWNVAEGRAVQHHNVGKPYSEVTAEERDPDEPRCSACEEDQEIVNPAKLGLPGVPPFRVCWVFRPRVEEALRKVASDPGFEVRLIVGYRNGRTRGPVVAGVHTTFSNHSYGTAVDVNAAFNGLYNRCDVAEVTPKSITSCRLSMGGGWKPATRPRVTITAGGPLWRAFGTFWKWGGQIHGSLRDLMHFSITGY